MSTRNLVVTAAIGLLIAIGARSVIAGPVQDAKQDPPEVTPVRPPQEAPPGVVRPIDVTLRLPVVGNVQAVRSWHFARIERVEGLVGDTDVTLFLRDARGEISEVLAPRAPLRDLAFASNWVRTESKSQLTRNDYAERMVAVDVDERGRLIAIASLEPIDRDRGKLRRAIGG